MPNLSDLVAAIEAIAEDVDELPKRVADRFTVQIDREFQRQQDPYGNPWAPLAAITIKKKGHARILWKEGDMERETRAIAEGSTIRFEGTDYGPIHQTEHVNRWLTLTPGRPQIPNESQLPKTWQDAIADELGQSVRDALKR